MNKNIALTVFLICLVLIQNISLFALPITDPLIQADLSQIMKGNLVLVSGKSFYYGETINLIKKMLLQCADKQGVHIFKAEQFSNPGFDNNLTSAINKFQKLYLPNMVIQSGSIDKPTVLRLLLVNATVDPDIRTFLGLTRIAESDILNGMAILAVDQQHAEPQLISKIQSALQNYAKRNKEQFVFTPGQYDTALAIAVARYQKEYLNIQLNDWVAGMVDQVTLDSLLTNFSLLTGNGITDQPLVPQTPTSQPVLANQAKTQAMALVKATEKPVIKSASKPLSTTTSDLLSKPIITEPKPVELSDTPFSKTNIVVTIGQSKTIAISRPLKDVAIGNTKVANINTINNGKVIITGLTNGVTSLTFFYADGKQENYLINVVKTFTSERTVAFYLKHIYLQKVEADQNLNRVSVADNPGLIKPLEKMLTTVIDSNRFSIFPSLGMITVQGSADDVSRVGELLSEIDSPIEQLVIHTQIFEISSDIAKNIGFTHAAQSGVLDGSFVPETGSGGIFTFTHSASLTSALVTRLQLLETEGKARTLANPQILSQSGEISDIFVGRQIPVVSTDKNGQQTVDKLETGIKLVISPRVNQDGSITTWIGTYVSSITTTMYQGLPEISSRQARTTVHIQNGETIVIGGLKSSEYADTINQIPILGDIPLIGELFKGTQRNLKETEIIITITPQIVPKI